MNLNNTSDKIKCKFDEYELSVPEIILFFFFFFFSIDNCKNVLYASSSKYVFVYVRKKVRLSEMAICKFSIFLDYDGVGCLCFFQYVSSLLICVRARPYAVFAFLPLLLSVFMKDVHIML